MLTGARKGEGEEREKRERGRWGARLGGGGATFGGGGRSSCSSSKTRRKGFLVGEGRGEGGLRPLKTSSPSSLFLQAPFP